VELQEELWKLQKYREPAGLRHKVFAELQRSWYPFRASTLLKFRELVSDLRDRLALAVQVLQLDVSITSQTTLTQINARTKELAMWSMAIEHSVGHIQSQNLAIGDRLDSVLDGQQANMFREIIKWLSPSDPISNHHAARRKHQDHTGSWLLDSARYSEWKSSERRHLWLHGKAGCGKTVLCSTVVQDIYSSYGSDDSVGCAMFYLTFSDQHKQSYEDLLKSLVAQMCWKEPGFAKLRHVYERPNATLPGPDTLEDMVVSSANQFTQVFLLLDALDECPEDDGARSDLLEGLQRLSDSVPTLKLFATSRSLTEIQTVMEEMGADAVSIDVGLANADIRTYVDEQLKKDRKLSSFDDPTKQLIQQTFAEKADGM